MFLNGVAIDEKYTVGNILIVLIASCNSSWLLTVGVAGDFFDVTYSGGVADIKRKGQQPFTVDQQFQINIMATDVRGESPQVSQATVEIKAGTRKPQFNKQQFDYQFQEDNVVNQR